MIVIGLTGPAGSGKTTVANYLARTYGARLFALATPLKRIIQQAFDLPSSALWGTQEEKEAVIPGLGVSARFLMQRIGTNGVRAVLGDDFWVNCTLTEIEKSGAKLAVVEDVRFLSEASGLRDATTNNISTTNVTYIWKVNSPWHTSDQSHRSESEWREVKADHQISTSTKSLDALYLEVDRACAKFGILPNLHSIEAP